MYVCVCKRFHVPLSVFAWSFAKWTLNPSQIKVMHLHLWQQVSWETWLNVGHICNGEWNSVCPPLVCRRLTELYFLIARLLSQGPCRNASEVIYYHYDWFVDFLIRLNGLVFLSYSCRVRMDLGATTGVGDTRGECIAILWPCLCFHIRTSVKGPSVRVRVATWTARAFPSTKTLHTPEMMPIFSFVYLNVIGLCFCHVSYLSADWWSDIPQSQSIFFFVLFLVVTKTDRLAREWTRSNLCTSGKFFVHLVFKLSVTSSVRQTTVIMTWQNLVYG